MHVRITHPQYHSLVLENDLLKLKGKEQEITLHRGVVDEVTIALVDQSIHIVVLLNNQRLVHWHGESDFFAEDLGRNQQVIKGLQLVTDCEGKLHLFYLQQNVKQNDYTLIQRTFTDSWSEIVRVTNKISNMNDGYRVCPGLEKYLHLSYVGLDSGTLYYRCFELDSKLWSGAIPLVKEECSQPHIYLVQNHLLLIWVNETEEGKRLRGLWQKEHWGKPENLSSIGKDIYQPGLSWEQDLLTINWVEGNQLCYRFYEQQWSELITVDLEAKQRINRLAIIEESKVSCTWSIYEPFIEQEIRSANLVSKSPEPEVKGEVVTEVASQTKAVENTETQEQKQRKEVEKKFWQEAFQLHHEWQELRQDYQEVLKQGQELEVKLSERLQDLVAKQTVPEGNYIKEFNKLAEDLQLTNQRVTSLREEIRGIRQTGNHIRILEERVARLESNQVARPKTEESYLNLEKRIRFLEGQLHTLSQDVGKLHTASKKKYATRTFLKRLIWR